MNDAHLHMVVNHFPIIGIIFGVGILIAGIILKNRAIQNTAYVLFVICMVFGKISMFTGEKAEDIVENIGVSHDVIHEHEELAEDFMKVAYGLGLFAVISLVANEKKHPRAKLFAFLTLILAIAATVLAKEVGTSGGEIRHTEIREKQ